VRRVEDKRRRAVEELGQEKAKMEEMRREFNSKMTQLAVELADQKIRGDKLEYDKMKMTEDMQEMTKVQEHAIAELKQIHVEKENIARENEEIVSTLSHMKQKEEDVKQLNRQLDELQKSKKLIEERCAAAEKVLQGLALDNLSFEDKENRGELEVFVEENSSGSRPASRRRDAKTSGGPGSHPVLRTSSLQNSSKIPAAVAGSACCDLQSEVARLRSERDAALHKLLKTRSVLKETAEKLSTSNKRKTQVEKAICKQLTKTHDVLKKAKGNLASCSGES